MKTARKIALMSACIALALAFVTGGGAVLASYGDQNDPLVSLSYLTNDFTDALLKKADERIAEREKSINATIQTKINEYIQTVGQSGGDDSGFKVVTLSSGQTLSGYTGTEIMLRSGSAACSAAASPGLVDTTTGGILSSGGTVAENHLYIVTADGRGVKAANGCTLLVRGAYTIS